MPITFDIETIPKQGDALEHFINAELENFKAPSSLNKTQAIIDLGGEPNSKDWKFKSKDDCIAEWEKEFCTTKAPEVAEEKWRKTALDGAQGEIISIAWKFEDSTTECKFRNVGDSESELLESFFLSLTEILSGRKPMFCGHNIAAFDLKFLFHRCVVLGINPLLKLPFYGRHGSDYFDNMIAWTGYRTERISQDNLSKALGLQGKPNDIDGSKVWDFVKAGKVIEVAEYNKDDVDQAYEIYKRLNFLV